MDKWFLIQIFGLGVVGAVGSIILKQSGKETSALLLDIAVIVIGFGMVLYKIKAILDSIITMFGV